MKLHKLFLYSYKYFVYQTIYLKHYFSHPQIVRSAWSLTTTTIPPIRYPVKVWGLRVIKTLKCWTNPKTAAYNSKLKEEGAESDANKSFHIWNAARICFSFCL